MSTPTTASQTTRTAPRLRQVAGGWLLARDLRDAPALTSLRLAQHHIAAHKSWGVSGGLHVIAGRGQLWVGAGCAVDRCGRTAVLPRAVALPLAEGSASVVVLAPCGDGPAGHVLLREPGTEQPTDIPLARLDGSGDAQDGDGDRQWLRRPGPCVRLGGLIPRGTPLLEPSYAYAWRAHVDLAEHRLDAPPAVIATAAGAPADPLSISTTVEVTSVDATGFEVVVRHAVNVIAGLTTDRIRTAPHAVAWMAVVPAARPEFPTEEFA